VRTVAGDSEANDPRFPAYLEIENMRSYPDVIQDGEEVVATEKIHGTNCRVGFVVNDGQMVRMAGSKGLRRKEPESDEAKRLNTYWYPHTLPEVTALLADLRKTGYEQAVLYGEVYGRGIQAYTYGQNTIAFRAFDLMVEGKFVDHDEFSALCRLHGVDVVPIVFRGAFSLATIKQLSEGDSLVGGGLAREGVVVRPTVERQDVRIGRVILKYISDTYLFGKAAEQDTTDI